VRKTHRRALIAALAGGAALLAVVAFLVVRAAGEPDAPLRHLTLAAPDGVGGALAVVAAGRGYFAREGLDVELRRMPSDTAAIELVLEGGAELAITGDVPLSYQVVRRRRLAALATVGFSDRTHRVVARRDRGIGRPADLSGKSIGVERLSADNVFLFLFLSQSGVPRSAVTIVPAAAADLPRALAEGRIDAAALREPLAVAAERLLGDQAIRFDASHRFHQYDVLVAAPALVSDDGDVPVRVLRALLRAERFSRRDPAAAQAEVTSWLGPERRDEVSAEWTRYRFEVALGRGLLIALESHARWLTAIDPELVGPPPDFLALVQPGPLRRLRPERVTLR